MKIVSVRMDIAQFGSVSEGVDSPLSFCYNISIGGDAMFVYKSGDILKSSAQNIVNPVNTHGRSGKGLALHIKKAYPLVDREFSYVCQSGEFEIGSILRLPTPDNRYILFFPTKEDWKHPSKYEYIHAGLETLRFICQTLPENSSVAIPKLGCGLGGLDWLKVHGLILQYLKDINHVVFYIYGPNVGGQEE